MVIFIMLITFTFAVYASKGEQDLWGSPANVHRALEKASASTYVYMYMYQYKSLGSWKVLGDPLGVLGRPLVILGGPW